jgi:hypothetical protein
VSATGSTTNFTGGVQGQRLFFATVPSGNSGSIVLTYNQATTDSVVFVYIVNNRQNIGTNEINGYGDTAPAVTRTTYTSPLITVPTNGFVLSIFTHNGTDLTFTSSTLTIDQDVYLSGNRVGLSYNNIGSASFSLTNTLTWGGESGSTASRIWAFN